VLKRNALGYAVVCLLGLGVFQTADAGLINGSFEQPDITGSCVGGGSPRVTHCECISCSRLANNCQ